MRHIVGLWYLLAIMTLVACGPDGGTTSVPPTRESFIGIWDLHTVDGKSLPYVQSPGDHQLEVLSSQVAVGADGRFHQSTRIRWTIGWEEYAPTEWLNDGTCTLDGVTATFSSSYWDILRLATVSTTTMSAKVDGHTWVYRKS
jgi:hypothetical protein